MIDSSFKFAGIAGAMALAISASVVAEDAVQWRVEDGGNGHWYETDTSNLCFNQALTKFLSLGGNLVSINSQAENFFVSSLIPNGSSALLGLYQDQNSPDYTEPDGGWRWTDETTVKFTSWGGIEPNNAVSGEDFVTTNPDGWWGDTMICGYSNTELTIIEWSADCNGDGIVDYGQIQDGTFADNNANGVPDCCDAGTACDRCLGDLNGDGIVGPPDLGILLAVWGTDGGDIEAADINGDGTVDGIDLGILFSAWGPCP